MAGNKNLSAANKAKKDEFYTQLPDIANELRHYREQFRGKTVLCNCDDPYESNFFKFFAANFNAWGLRKLICTCWEGSKVAGTELSLFDAPSSAPAEPERKAYKIELTELYDANGDGAEDLLDVELILRKHPPVELHRSSDRYPAGDFRSPECVALLSEADIVVTNPPFSLFREYVALLMKHGKKFLIIGNQNAITYKEIFPLIKENKIWLGFGFNKGNAYFALPDKEYALHYVGGVFDEATGLVKFRNCHWFTNLEHHKRHEPLDLYKHYSPEEYPHYLNYDAIEVSKTADIPMDYEGVMGVPISFMDKYCPEQFEILGITDRDSPLKTKEYTIDDSPNYGDLNRRAAIMVKGKLTSTYARLLIRPVRQP